MFPTTADGVKLHGWHIPGPSPDVVWLIFHGNGGNISVRMNQYQEIHRRYGGSILAIDYRGYGRSEGLPSEGGFYADALAARMLATELHPARFSATKHVANLPVPTLVIHGDSNRTVSPANAERIFGAASDPKQLEIVPGGDHEGLDLVEPERYHLVLTDFLRKYDAL